MQELSDFLQYIGLSEYIENLRKIHVSSMSELYRVTEQTLQESGIPLGPRKKLVSEVHKHRIRTLLSDAKKEDMFFEQAFPQGSEARKMFGHGTAF